MVFVLCVDCINMQNSLLWVIKDVANKWFLTTGSLQYRVCLVLFPLAQCGCPGGCRLSCRAQGNDKWCTLYLLNNYVLVQSTWCDSNNFLLNSHSFIMATYVLWEYTGPCHDASAVYDKYSYEYFFTIKKLNGSYSEMCLILAKWHPVKATKNL
jgi:hypothetical protein